MTISEICKYECTKVWQSIRIIAVALCIATASLPLSRVQGRYANTTAFVVAGSQFHERYPEDAGEARICIQNTGLRPLSMIQLKVRIVAKRDIDTEKLNTECKYVYAKLSPPVLQREQYGEILVKLLDRPARNCYLIYTVSTGDGTISHEACLAEPPLWVSFVGFSEDLRRIFIYVKNLGRESIKAKLLRVGDFDIKDRMKTVYFPIPPEDKGCLIGDLPSPFTPGQFIHAVLAVNIGGRESKVHTVIRVIHAVPLVAEHGSGDPSLRLDIKRPFLQTMACPAHAHGTHEAAATKFLDDYTQQFTENPRRAIQIAICRYDMPRAWFRFGDLPDVAAMNTCLRPPPCYYRDPQEWFCPFSCVGDLAKKATEPGRFLAIIPVDERSSILKGLTYQECRFLVYCAVACGAKGVIYRGQPASDPLSRDAFRQLNRELQYLKPLLSIAEPIEWFTTEANNYVAKGLLCGDQAILAIIFDRRYLSRQEYGRFHTPPFGRAVIPVRINGRIPQGITVQGITTPFASLDRSCWDYRNGILEFKADMIYSAQIYIVSIQPQNHPMEGGLSR